MTRSHPPTLLTLARRLIREYALLPRGKTALVAVSGGPDSMALLHALGTLAASLGIRLAAHGVDHGLRTEAAAELELASDLARSLGIPFAVTRVCVTPGANLQARARDARRAALEAAAGVAGAATIATGHHADDRAETVLLRLLRGSGPAGLACLPPAAGAWVRPLLRARRRDIEAHIARHGLQAASDPSNLDPRFARTRVRMTLLPLLTELSPGVVNHLNGLADDLLELGLEGHGAGLRRAQREAARQAARLGKGAVTVRVAGGVELAVSVRNGQFLVESRGDGRPAGAVVAD